MALRLLRYTWAVPKFPSICSPRATCFINVTTFNISRFINKLDNKYKGIPTIEQIEGRDVAGMQKKNHLPLLGKVVLIFFIYSFSESRNYIIPPMPPIPGAPIGISGLSSFFSTITHSVVRNIPAIEAAFSKATRATLAGSTTPAACKFS